MKTKAHSTPHHFLHLLGTPKSLWPVHFMLISDSALKKNGSGAPGILYTQGTEQRRPTSTDAGKFELSNRQI
jgi:hypothetical protein